MQMAETAQRLDWDGWIRGIFGALISGGAGAIAAGTAVSYADPTHDLSVFKVMYITFLVSGAVSLAKFLQITPVPNKVTTEVKQVTTLTQTTQTQVQGADTTKP